MLNALPHPVYFVRNDPKLCEHLSTVTEMPAFHEFYKPESGGSSSWIVQTFLQLKLRGLDVHLVPHYVAGKICVVSREELMKRQLMKHLPFQSYLVVCQQDRPRPLICQHRIVQNQLNVLEPTDHFLPHWSQPELRSRDVTRGNQLANLTFKGRWYYLPEPFKSPEFVTKLSSLGIQFSVLPEYEVDLTDWSDYSQADVLLATRSNVPTYLASKPPTKLINSWLAGCPALLGAEPAYQALRQSELDYIEVKTPEDVIAALQRLRESPELYAAMVENGKQRAKEFLPECTAQHWRDLLAGAIADGYKRWATQSWAWKFAGRPIQFGYRLTRQELERRQFNAITGRKRS
jgi:hypothetical protein